MRWRRRLKVRYLRYTAAILIRAANLRAATFGLPADDQSSHTDCWTERKDHCRINGDHKYFLQRSAKMEGGTLLGHVLHLLHVLDPNFIRFLLYCVKSPHRSAWQLESLTRVVCNFSNTQLIAHCTKSSSSGNLGRNVNYRTLITPLTQHASIRMTWSLPDCASAFSVSAFCCEVSHYNLVTMGVLYNSFPL